MENTTKTVTLAELAEHNVKNDLWIAVHGKVYQLENFATDHPGGIDVLLECAGSDATETYDYAGHSIGAIQTLGHFLIGSLEGHVDVVPTRVQPENLHASKSSGTLNTSAGLSWSLGQYKHYPWAAIIAIVLGGAALLYAFNALNAMAQTLSMHELGHQNAFTVVCVGLLLATFLAGIGTNHVYGQFAKTLEHTKEPFDYPAIIPRKGFY